MKPDIGLTPRFLHTPLVFDALVGGSPRQNIALRFGVKKLEWCDYPTVKKKFEDTFIRFDRIHERDRQTPHRPRICIASRGNY